MIEPGNCRIERGRSPAVEPLEVWHLELDGKPVRRHLGVPDVDAMRARGASEREIGERIGARAGAFARQLRRGDYEPSQFPGNQQRTAGRVQGCRHVCFAGGLSRLPGFRSAASRACDDVWVLGGGAEGAALRGAVEVVDGGPGDSSELFVVDVGQTAVKSGVLRPVDGASPEIAHHRRASRPLSRLPIVVPNTEAAPENRPQDSSADDSVEFIAETIAEARHKISDPPTTVVLALPCELDEDLTPGVSTYEGWDRTPNLVERLVRRSGLAENARRAVVLNDAELAGCAARLEADDRDRSGDVLVLTLGFGPGGAYVSEAGDE